VAQRAQCHLLLSQPEEALRELTLVHDLCRLLEAKPTGRPVTMVAAMVETAVTTIYANAVADGLRLHAWREPQLDMIQNQLAEVRLLPMLAEALRHDRAKRLCVLENFLTATEKKSAAGSFETNRWRKNESLETGAEALLMRGWKLGAPRGWFDQNRASLSRLEQRAINSLDLTNNLIAVKRVNAWGDEMKRIGPLFCPYTFYAANVVPNYFGAFRAVAKNQTLANQALIACGLERCRLKDGQYPPTLDRLPPQFIKTLPRDVIGGNTMRYRCIDARSFLLYSIGWDNKDDGGVSSPDIAKGDWVWSSSTN